MADEAQDMQEVGSPVVEQRPLDDAAPSSFLPSLLLCIIAIGGITIRLIVYLQNRPLWTDEAALATNILTRPFSELHQPLANEQAAPVGFLYAVKAATSLFGNSEFALRFLPLIAGILTFVLAAVFAQRHLRQAHGACMLIFLAFSPMHIYYSAELKQYGTDLLIAFGLIFAGIEVARRPAAATIIGWCVFASLCIWFSHPAIFVIPGGILAIALCARCGPYRLAALTLGAILITLSFVSNYILITHSIQGSRYLHEFWAGAMRPEGGPADVAMWLLSAIRPTLTLVRELASWHVGLILLVVGLPLLFCRNRTLLILCGTPVLCALAAAMLRLYPFRGRFLLFALPGLFILYSSIALVKWRKTRILAPAIVLAAIFPSYAPLLRLEYQPVFPTTIRDVVEEMSKDVRPGDHVFVMGPTHLLFGYYALRYDFSRQVIRRAALSAADAGDGYEAVRANGRGRCWVLCSNFTGPRSAIPALLFGRLDRLSPRERYIKTDSAWASLYDLKQVDR